MVIRVCFSWKLFVLKLRICKTSYTLIFEVSFFELTLELLKRFLLWKRTCHSLLSQQFAINLFLQLIFRKYESPHNWRPRIWNTGQLPNTVDKIKWAVWQTSYSTVSRCFICSRIFETLIKRWETSCVNNWFPSFSRQLSDCVGSRSRVFILKCWYSIYWFFTSLFCCKWNFILEKLFNFSPSIPHFPTWCFFKNPIDLVLTFL